MRHYHKQPNHFFRPTINIDKVSACSWTKSGNTPGVLTVILPTPSSSSPSQLLRLTHQRVPSLSLTSANLVPTSLYVSSTPPSDPAGNPTLNLLINTFPSFYSSVRAELPSLSSSRLDSFPRRLRRRSRRLVVSSRSLLKQAEINSHFI